jgi:hypothetical protein
MLAVFTRMASPICNEERRQQASAKIVSLARGVLAGQVGIVAASRQFAAWRFDVGGEHEPDFVFFVSVDSETDHLPVGDVRLYWSPDVLRAKDDELRDFEASVRNEAFLVCRSLLERYETHIG